MKTICIFLIVLFQQNVFAFDFTIIHTNDLHSYIAGIGPDGLYTPKANDGDPVFGHYARLSYLIAKPKKQLQSKKEPY